MTSSTMRLLGIIGAMTIAHPFYGDHVAEGATTIDMTNAHYGQGTSVDSGSALLWADGYVFTAGSSYGGFAAARIDGNSGTLVPGSGATSWGYGKIADPTSSPVGWVAFYPASTTGTPTASSMALSDGLLYLTGPAAQGLSAGFGVVAIADGSVSNVRHLSPRDSIPNSGLGATPGGDIVVTGDRAYIFGHAAVGSYNDKTWVGRRYLDGTPDYGYGDACFGNPPPPCDGLQTGFSLHLTSYASVAYGDTDVASGVAYSVFLASSSSSNGRILVTSVDVDAGGLMQSAFTDGSSSSTYNPKAIVVQDDGKFVIAGSEGTSLTSMFVSRYNTDGTPDTTFGTGGKVSLNLNPYQDDISDLALNADGTIVAVGASGSSAFSARFLSDGTLDTDYSPTGYQLVTISGRNSRFNAVVIEGTTVRATGSSTNGTNPDLLIAELVAAP